MQLKLIYNNVWLDSFFLKSMMVYDHTQHTNRPLRTTFKPHYGDLVVGSSFRFVATQTDDTTFIMVGNQLSQSSYGALLPPYSHTGIGRSNNYIESFVAAFSFIFEKKYSILMKTPIIPNSQLVVFANNGNVDYWNYELFSNPDQNLYLILFGCGILLVIFGVVIIILHSKEKRLDRK